MGSLAGTLCGPPVSLGLRHTEGADYSCGNSNVGWVKRSGPTKPRREALPRSKELLRNGSVGYGATAPNPPYIGPFRPANRCFLYFFLSVIA